MQNVPSATRCGSGTLAKFDPRPNENQRFKPPKSLELEGF